MKLFFAFLLLCFSVTLWAQPTSGQVAYYSIDSCTLIDNTGNGSNGTLFGSQCETCGVSGQAIYFNPSPVESPPQHDYALLLGLINNEFRLNNFTISFYIKPTDNQGTKDLISKRQTCTDTPGFSIRFVSATNSISVELTESANKSIVVSAPLDFGNCWQHIAFVRNGKNSSLYINGELKADKDTNDGSTINLDNNAVLKISDSPCLSTLDVPFSGILDELYVYKRALQQDDIRSLYLGPDKILTENTTIFLGESVQLEGSESCADSYEWSPANFLDDPNALDPLCTPDSSILYTLTYTEDQVCIAFDTVRISVIDPSILGCDDIFLPKAFTPNGDNLNDTYGISNPYAIDESNLLSFEIFDRWGSRVFFTDKPFDQWDGSYNGKPLNPGVLLYRIRFTCEGEEQIDVGSLAIIR